MDHLLFPTLTDSAFVTEIHHIDGEGVDSGVVYCEMQARENEMDDVLEYERRQMLFTDQNKSLKSETGGRLRELRDITNKQIQDYHKAYYAPNNICCIVCGMQCKSIVYSSNCNTNSLSITSYLTSRFVMHSCN